MLELVNDILGFRRPLIPFLIIARQKGCVVKVMMLSFDTMTIKAPTRQVNQHNIF